MALGHEYKNPPQFSGTIWIWGTIMKAGLDAQCDLLHNALFGSQDGDLMGVFRRHYSIGYLLIQQCCTSLKGDVYVGPRDNQADQQTQNCAIWRPSFVRSSRADAIGDRNDVLL